MTLARLIDALLRGDPVDLDQAELKALAATIKERDRLAARGLLAGGVAAELAVPLVRIHEILAGAVDRLDRHVASAKGPEPLPWVQVSRVREELLDAYLDVGRAARLAGDLAATVSGVGREESETDVNDVVERAVALSRHGLGEGCDLMLDLGTLPTLRVDGPRLAQALAHLILQAVQAAEPNAPVVVRTMMDADMVVVVIAGGSSAEPPFAELVHEMIAAETGRISYVRQDGQVAVEIALPTPKKTK